LHSPVVVHALIRSTLVKMHVIILRGSEGMH
jgi:hypothetical protein